MVRVSAVSQWVDTYGNLREDTDNDKSLNVYTDKMLSFYLDPESGESKVKRYDVSSNPYPDLATATPVYLALEDINPVWEAGKRLAYRDSDTRRIYTFADGDGDGQADSGEFSWGLSTSRAYFPRDHETYCDSELNLVDWLRQYSSDQEETFVRGFLGRMLFSGEESQKQAQVLSGGERVRCMMARMMLSGANVLLMDEPTNHLDLEAITALNNGLTAFGGRDEDD